MFRKYGIVLIVLALLLPVALPTYAQEDVPLLFDMTTIVEVPALGFDFLAPDGWVQGESTAGDGIIWAENDADLAAELDGDDTTDPVGYTISARYLPLDAIGLAADSSTQVVADFLVQQAGLTVTEQFDYAVLGRHSIFIHGVDADGDLGMANVWVQDGQLVFFGLGLPVGAEVTDETYYTWGYVLGSARHLAAEEFLPTETYEAAEYGGFTISYPTGWSTGIDEFNNTYLIQFADDLALVNNTEPATGIGVMWAPLPLDTFGLTADSTVDDLRTVLTTSNPDVTLEEYMLFDQVGFGIPYLDGSNLIITGIKDGELYFFLLYTPSADDMQVNKGALLNLLLTIETNA